MFVVLCIGIFLNVVSVFCSFSFHCDGCPCFILLLLLHQICNSDYEEVFC